MYSVRDYRDTSRVRCDHGNAERNEYGESSPGLSGIYRSVL
jgi:hypothetical protein